MVYEIKCNTCNNKYKYSTKEETVTHTVDKNGIFTYVWDCKNCHNLIHAKATKIAN